MTITALFKVGEIEKEITVEDNDYNKILKHLNAVVEEENGKVICVIYWEEKKFLDNNILNNLA